MHSSPNREIEPRSGIYHEVSEWMPRGKKDDIFLAERKSDGNLRSRSRHGRSKPRGQHAYRTGLALPRS